MEWYGNTPLGCTTVNRTSTGTYRTVPSISYSRYTHTINRGAGPIGEPTTAQEHIEATNITIRDIMHGIEGIQRQIEKYASQQDRDFELTEMYISTYLVEISKYIETASEGCLTNKLLLWNRVKKELKLDQQE